MDSFPSPSVAWPPPPATRRLILTALLAPDYLPYLPVLDRLYTLTSVHYLWTPPTVLCLLSCHLLTYPQVPLGPCSPALQASFCHLPPRMFAPLSPPSTLLASLTTPVGAPFWVPPSYTMSLNHPPPPPCRPRPTTRSLPVPRRVLSPVPGLLLPSIVLPPHPLLWHPISWCLLVVCIIMGAL